MRAHARALWHNLIWHGGQPRHTCVWHKVLRNLFMFMWPLSPPRSHTKRFFAAVNTQASTSSIYSVRIVQMCEISQRDVFSDLIVRFFLFTATNMHKITARLGLAAAMLPIAHQHQNVRRKMAANKCVYSEISRFFLVFAWANIFLLVKLSVKCFYFVIAYHFVVLELNYARINEALAVYICFFRVFN